MGEEAEGRVVKRYLTAIRLMADRSPNHSSLRMFRAIKKDP